MEKLRILFTGDSITDVNRTDMVRMTEEWMSRDPNATPQQREEAVNRALGCGYPLLVASQLGAQEPGRYEFLNRGISGNRVVDLDARIKRDCINLRPDVISILIGVNDVWHELGEHNGVDATGIARNMVAMFGMSDEFGMMALASRRSQYLDGGYGMDCAQDTAARMDQAVKDILDQCYQQAVEVIKASREDMDKVVAYLLEKETITGAEMVAIIEGRDPELVENPYASTRAEDKAFRPSSPETIEAPAKKVHMISQKIESPEEPAQEGQPENPVSDPSPSGGDAPQESGSTPSEPPKDTP